MSRMRRMMVASSKKADMVLRNDRKFLTFSKIRAISTSPGVPGIDDVIFMELEE